MNIKLAQQEDDWLGFHFSQTDIKLFSSKFQRTTHRLKRRLVQKVTNTFKCGDTIASIYFEIKSTFFSIQTTAQN